jgi:hypothetical protein
MHNETMKTRARRPWRLRAAATTGMLAATLVLCATTAEAADYWQYWGPQRATAAEAQGDLPTLEMQCRKDGGIVENSGLLPVYPADGDKQAFVGCRALRPS